MTLAQILKGMTRKQFSASRKIIERAQTRLRTHGWTRGKFRSNKGEYCIAAALGCNDSIPTELKALVGVGINKTFAKRSAYSWTPITWNDAPGRKKREVLAALRRARSIAAAGAQGRKVV